MTSRADYTDEEWALLHRAPMTAGLAISLADPGGPIELTKETWAAIRTMDAPPSDDELLVAISQARLLSQAEGGEDVFELRGCPSAKRSSMSCAG